MLGTSTDTLLGIDIQVMRDGPQISHEQALDVIRPVSSNEVEVAINGIDDGKSLGIFRMVGF